MAIGKNKKLGKKKGSKKKTIDPFARKDWFDVKAPQVFIKRDVCKTPVNKTVGTKVASEQVKGRVFTTCLADLQGDEEQSFRKVKLVVEDTQGTKCLTNFHGMDLTTDKLRSLVRKWQTLIDAQIDVKTLDGYTLSIFAIGFTKRRPNQERKTSYAQSSQIRAIRKKMFEIIKREVQTVELKDLVVKFIPEAIGKMIEKETQGIYPLQNCYIRKVKVLKTPKFDAYKLLELHGELQSQATAAAAAAAAPAAAAEDKGAKV